MDGMKTNLYWIIYFILSLILGFILSQFGLFNYRIGFLFGPILSLYGGTKYIFIYLLETLITLPFLGFYIKNRKFVYIVIFVIMWCVTGYLFQYALMYS
jgi:hypothetical protein